MTRTHEDEVTILELLLHFLDSLVDWDEKIRIGHGLTHTLHHDLDEIVGFFDIFGLAFEFFVGKEDIFVSTSGH